MSITELTQSNTIEDSTLAQELANALLGGAVFAGFNFAFHFSLQFGGPAGRLFRGVELPAWVELNLIGDWSATFGKNVEGSNAPNVAKFSEDDGARAAWLTSLRWMEGAVLEDVRVEASETVFRFKGGHEIVVGWAEDGASWDLWVPNRSIDRRFSVAVENDACHVRFPGAPTAPPSQE